MSIYFEIAYAAVSGRLCLFTGTGFSKALTENKTPGWEALLRQACVDLPNAASLIDELFETTTNNKLSLEECAQVISIERERNGLVDIHQICADLVKDLVPSGTNSSLTRFVSGKKLTVVTTNYDKLMEQILGPSNCNSICPGLPIPRNSLDYNIYHIHGSVDSPMNMVITADDYFRFMRGETYLSRKLSTVLHEDTVVILGYSLSDTNLRAILSDYKGFSKDQVSGSNVIFVSRDPVAQTTRDYYSASYGIRVIESTSISDFFLAAEDSISEASKCIDKSQSNIRKVLDENHSFKENYLRIESSFYEIITSVRAIGRSIDDGRVVEALGDVISKKITLTGENSAWEQYAHLANWLIYLASILDISGTAVEEVFVHGTLRSMNTMSKTLQLGYSWQAFKNWRAKWFDISAPNRALIRNTILGLDAPRPCAVEIVSLG